MESGFLHVWSGRISFLLLWCLMLGLAIGTLWEGVRARRRDGDGMRISWLLPAGLALSAAILALVLLGPLGTHGDVQAELRGKGHLDPCLESCAGGDGASCELAAGSYASLPARSPDLARVARALGKGCSLGVPGACHNLGYYRQNGYGLPQDSDLAARLYLKACNLGEPRSCLNLGIGYVFGMGVEKDAALAAALFGRECLRGMTAACSSLGILYAQGEGVPRNLGYARALCRAACGGGDELGCQNVDTLDEVELSPAGFVDVGMEGGWAWIWIDGHRIRTTPLFGYRLPTGRHEVVLKDVGGNEIREWIIQVRMNETVKLMQMAP